MPVIKNEHTAPGRVIVRAKAPDAYEGLRGQLYLDGRLLGQPVKRIDLHAAQREEAVLNVLAAEQARRTPIKAVAISADGSMQELELAPVFSITLAKLRTRRP